uniref:Rieske domain-containing protein n=1 Tax=Chlamydomonas leiostraca TaxID=1034604 RepID=A0A7S0RGI2_9CHLO|mmetsp:Transcript_21955/g.55907  ORF Transcript_21955/g.55907 Transcript_21955/m.55907 type:complete len:742 (+) Transcript_21955:227-2452(+)|eukprot:CAMPEP_0202861860 /NCGR_PEP_ID=MMETSP1391-20130828/3106_1 /ASSEMBLY_ACC=CAM_ASM_000867 /TAXON_ID=1034604 /ORGANISM="Chlamydomonas leiostraca, Strain SAG 11-49" /LENGTH=741 /DNA_ID=CAMNT_0049541301 /DNA_START=209 /DNA_END=2434 /DNA_ORIENTATION=+
MALGLTGLRQCVSRPSAGRSLGAQQHRPQLPALRVTRVCAKKDAVEQAKAVATDEKATEAESFFLEPALRSFLLGVSSGALLELCHVATKVIDFASAEGALAAMEFTPAMERLAVELAPLALWDNAAAIGACTFFYGIEVAAILAVLKTYPGEPDKQAKAILSLPTLPKKLLPYRLSALKRAVLMLLKPDLMLTPSTAAGISSPPSSPSSSPSSSSAANNVVPTTSAFLDATTTSSPRAGAGVGASVLDRPVATPVPPIGAPGGPMPPFPQPHAPKSAPGGGSGGKGGGSTAGRAAPSLRPKPAPPAAKKPEARISAPPAPAPPAAPKQQQAPGKLSPRAPPKPASFPTPAPGTGAAGGDVVAGVQAAGRAGVAPGAWAPGTQLPEGKRARELRERRAYLKNFWYAAALSTSVKPGAPHEVKLMGRKVVLFRDEDGTVKCLDSVCPHRGAPLSRGWTKSVEGHTCVVCPYHGWAFSGDGVLKEVPSSASQHHLPKRPLVEGYPVEERGGFVWLFFGSKSMPAAERPPIPWVPELAAPGWQAVYAEMEFKAPHWSVFDNALDMAHIHYIHADSFGNSSKPVIHGMTTQRDAWGLTGSFSIHNKPVNPLWEWTKVDSVPVELKAMLPMTSCVKISLGAGVQMVTFISTCPVDAHTSVNRVALVRNFAGWEGLDAWARSALHKILGEDKAMVEALEPEGQRAEVSLEADLPQIAFRRLRSEWAAMGYLVDPEVTESHNGSLGDL